MKNLFNTAPLKAAIVAGMMFGTVAASQPAAAQTIVKGMAIATLDAVIANSNAYKVADQQRKTTYKPQFDQAEQRRNQLAAQIKPLVDKFNVDRQAPNANQQTLSQQAQQIQQLQQSGQQELQLILQPVAMSQSYVQEQIDAKLNDAVKTAMKKKGITLLLSPDAVLAVNDNAYNLNQDILNELNTMVPSAQIVPPQGWEPRQIREARAAQAAQQGPAPTAGTPTQGR